MARTSINLVGQRFGSLTVLERDNNYVKEHNLKDQHIYWKCQCDCGKVKTISGAALRKGDVQSCGSGLCYPTAKNLLGQEFGALLVIELASQAKDRHLRWKCRCKCGVETIVSSRDLINGHTISCGCITSYGEYRIAKILSENKIPFKKQMTFTDCLSSNSMPLRFDFYVDNKFLLEYDGEQHFHPTHQFNLMDVKEIQARDQIKNNYCLQHNLILKRIPYTIMKSITLEDILGDKYIYDTTTNKLP